MRVTDSNPYQISDSAEHHNKEKSCVKISSRMPFLFQILFNIIIGGLLITAILLSNANFDKLGEYI